jgi:hypothetical protein
MDHETGLEILDLSWFNGNEVITLIGPRGSGKSTSIYCILFHLKNKCSNDIKKIKLERGIVLKPGHDLYWVDYLLPTCYVHQDSAQYVNRLTAISNESTSEGMFVIAEDWASSGRCRTPAGSPHGTPSGSLRSFFSHGENNEYDTTNSYQYRKWSYLLDGTALKKQIPISDLQNIIINYLVRGSGMLFYVEQNFVDVPKPIRIMTHWWFFSGHEKPRDLSLGSIMRTHQKVFLHSKYPRFLAIRVSDMRPFIFFPDMMTVQDDDKTIVGDDAIKFSKPPKIATGNPKDFPIIISPNDSIPIEHRLLMNSYLLS